MKANTIVLPNDDERGDILRSVGLSSEEPLLLAVEAMIAQARTERPAHPTWHPLSARNAEGIATAREALEAHGGWGRHKTKSKLEGVLHLESGRFLAVHNTCERTGMNKDLPRFASPRSRVATKSLRDDLQGDFCELFEDFGPVDADEGEGGNLTLHLCVFIMMETLDTGEEALVARAELIVGAECSDQGIKSCEFRLPLDLSGLTGTGAAVKSGTPNDGEAVEAEVSIRRKG
ncbi:hypothetical protein C8J30_101362 [Rhodobacter viridis]|uniref:Uncharacterized protein n=1 Tax=Rhodobacter viridis TaxID=1054202 RepID=A0A318U319_9RHOB|nr:hypothetical protein [Rhodobacter viridis]PYF12977.1 hypothetical protein C8J30_101362 [Rhodobacter viridis]